MSDKPLTMLEIHKRMRVLESEPSGDAEAEHAEGDDLVSAALRLCNAHLLAESYDRARKRWWYA
jgi:hypothetical protein